MMLNILKILRGHSDKDHRLDLSDIVSFLKEEYGMDAERKAVKRNLMDLEQIGFDIRYHKIIRSKGQPNENIICKDYYLERFFTDGELECLIDMVLFSPQIDQESAAGFIRKLANIGSLSLHVPDDPTLEGTFHSPSTEFFSNLTTLHSAIHQNRRVSFFLLSYGEDKALHPLQDELLMVSPYWIVANKGLFYLLGAQEGSRFIQSYPVDRLSSLQILTARAAKPVSGAVGAEASAGAYLAKHSNLLPGTVQAIRFTIPAGSLDEVVAQFGTDFTITQNADGLLYICVDANPEDVYFWALQHGGTVSVLQPSSLRARLLRTAENLYRAYRD